MNKVCWFGMWKTRAYVKYVWFIPLLLFNFYLHALPVFPGAEGFGSETSAGRGGQIIKVTNLNASGSGSLKAAIDASGPRVVVFEVAGVIDINDYLTINNPHITIAGQTAPSPGINIIGAGIWIKTSDVLLQHIRVRVGGRPNGPDPYTRSALRIYQNGKLTNNIVVDHCTFSWAVDENVTFWGYTSDNCREVTLNDCIVSEALDASIHPEGPHTRGLIVGEYVQKISIHRCLLAHNGLRNPYLKGGSSAVMINTLVYNPGVLAWHSGPEASSGSRPYQASIIGNVLKAGNSTGLIHNQFLNIGTAHGDSKVYVDDNIVMTPGINVGTVNKASLRCNNPQEAVWSEPAAIMSSGQVYDYVLENVGARPGDRDEHDNRIINEVRNGTGRIIDRVGDVGGFPSYPEVKQSLTLPGDPNGDSNGNGYTNLEEWLHQKKLEVESGSVRLNKEREVVSNGNQLSIGSFARQKLKIKVPDKSAQYRVRIFSPNGKQIFNGIEKSENYQIQIKNIERSDGIMVLQINNVQSNKTHSVVFSNLSVFAP